jgi:aminodeoxyfutalosine deaminase
VAPAAWPELFRQLPFAELHLHVEGSITPAIACELAARSGVHLAPEEVLARYNYADFAGFIEAFKWVTSLLRSPEDYSLIVQRLCEDLRRQNVRYAELTVSVGVMLLRKQNVEANFEAMQAAAAAENSFPRVQWIFDTVRQFGPGAAMEVARLAAGAKSAGVVAFGMGGDELSLPAEDFRGVYDYVAAQGLHRLVHAGEIGGPREIREAVELLGAERIGHGIAAVHDPALVEFLADRRIPLEVCPTSNLCTGALARQLGRAQVRPEDHPLPRLFRAGVPVTLGSDDPAMFRTSLLQECASALRTGLSLADVVHIARAGFEHAFLPEAEKADLIETFRTEVLRLGLV